MKFQKSSLSFGLGIGLIIFSFIIYIYANFILNLGDNQVVQAIAIEDDEIIERAKSMGMIFVNQLPTKPTKNQLTDSEIIEKAKKLGMEFPTKPLQTKTDISDEPPLLQVEIPQGASASEASKLLYEAGIIEDENEFTSFLLEKKITKVIRYGNFKFPPKIAHNEIANVIANQNFDS